MALCGARDSGNKSTWEVATLKIRSKREGVRLRYVPVESTRRTIEKRKEGKLRANGKTDFAAGALDGIEAVTSGYLPNANLGPCMPSDGLRDTAVVTVENQWVKGRCGGKRGWLDFVPAIRKAIRPSTMSENLWKKTRPSR